MARILDQYGRPYVIHRTRADMVRAKFDAAQSTDENTRHWSYTDSLAADASASYSVRKTLRERARYEVANNSYAKGIILSLATDTIGRGPRLQSQLAESRTNALLEAEFTRWAQATRLPRKLRTMRMARCVDGEAFALFVSNSRLGTPVQLDLRLIEASLRADERLRVLVVDDDSPDGTAAIVQEMARDNARVSVLVRRERRGRGYAGVEGFRRSLDMGGDPIVEMDADFSHDPASLPAVSYTHLTLPTTHSA